MQSKFSDIFRLRAWVMAYSGPLIYWYFSLFYVSLATGFMRDVWSIILQLLALMLGAAWGVLLNDYFDRDVDIAAGKSEIERGHGFSAKQVAALVVILLAVTISIQVFLTIWIVGPDLIYIALWILGILSSVFYSVPPLRFKTKGFTGLLVNSAIERPIPVLIIFSFSKYYGVEMIIFGLLTELIWTIFKHQRLDVKGDSIAKIKTAAVILGEKTSIKIVDLIINPLSVISAITLLIIAWIKLEDARVFISISLFLTVAGIITLLVMERKGILSSDPYILDPPYIVFLQFSYMAIILPSLAIPVLLKQPIFMPIIILYIFSVYKHVKYSISLIPGVVRRVLG